MTPTITTKPQATTPAPAPAPTPTPTPTPTLTPSSAPKLSVVVWCVVARTITASGDVTETVCGIFLAEHEALKCVQLADASTRRGDRTTRRVEKARVLIEAQWEAK